jgi:hypothetical protein
MKKLIIEITNKSKKKNKTITFGFDCTLRKLPAPEESQLYECELTVFNNSKITKQLILSALNNGEFGLMEKFNIEFPSSNRPNIYWAYKESCFKYNVLSISDF